MIIESFYLPNIEYFNLILQYDEICIEIHENYQKQSYRNRCKILTSNKLADLIVPVIDGNSKIKIKNIKIDYNQYWVRNQLMTIRSAYGKAPFFEHFFDYFRIIFEKKHDFLLDFNIELLTLCLKLMNVKKKISFSTEYNKIAKNDYRGILHPKKEEQRIKNIQFVEYSQNFGEKFVPNLSIIDLLMCQGNYSLAIINNSKNEHIFT